MKGRGTGLARGLGRAAALLALWVLGVALALALLAFSAPPPSPAGPLPEVHGAYHVHSRRSDGRGTDAEIAAAARRAGLQFVVLTDHNLEVLPPPRFVDGVLLLWAPEESTPSGHVVALGVPRGLTAAERGEGAVERIRALGGHPMLAHPVQRHWPWSDWEAARAADGLELLSGDTAFREALARPFRRLLPAAAAWLGSPRHALLSLLVDVPGARARLLSLVGPQHPMVALCGLDAHGRPPYELLFRLFSMHLPGLVSLPAEPTRAALTVQSALASGKAYCAVDGMGFATGFRPLGEGPARVGERRALFVPPTGLTTRVQVYGPAHLEADGRTVALDGVGAVQVEVWARTRDILLRPVWKPWIVPSPFWVGPRREDTMRQTTPRQAQEAKAAPEGGRG